MGNITSSRVIFYVAIFFTLFFNYSFFKNVIEVYGLDGYSPVYIISIVLVLVFFLIFFFTLLSARFIFKPILIITLIISSFTAYFMDTYSVVIDSEMIRNAMQTNLNESLDLFSWKLVVYVLLLGAIPSLIIYKIKIEKRTFKQELIGKIKALGFSLLVIVVLLLSFSKFYTSFFREHKPLRYHVNPIYWIYSIGKYTNATFNSGPIIVKPLGEDAKVVHEGGLGKAEGPELVIMVVGEAARADRFSLNGYERETNPLLKKEDIINFSDMHSCGTATAQSVPCMFSVFDRADYDHEKGITTENVIDVLKHTGFVNILWRDNNSDSKGVALRVDFEDYRTPKTNTICDGGECRDEGMLVGLDAYIKKHKGEDILIVLHQMGNHGPAYYKRYPKEFEKFTPICKTNQLEECTQEEVSNAYDNAILYTDYFLSKVINFLKAYSKDHETAMIYMSDHGESLGENGLYLHGMPYLIAPETQKHIASVMWFGGEMKKDIDTKKLNAYKDKEFSQDNLFHTLLGIFEVGSKVYDKNKDILYNAKKH